MAKVKIKILKPENNESKSHPKNTINAVMNIIPKDIRNLIYEEICKADPDYPIILFFDCCKSNDLFPIIFLDLINKIKSKDILAIGLFHLCKSGNLSKIKCVLCIIGSFSVKDFNTAIKFNRLDIVKYLYQNKGKCDSHELCTDDSLYHGSKTGNKELVKFLLDVRYK